MRNHRGTRPLLTTVLAAATLMPSSAVAAPPRQDPDSFTPLALDVLDAPWAVKGSDGRLHTVYELRLLNTTSLPWRVTGVSTHSATGRGRVLARWSGRRVRGVMRSLRTRNDTRLVGPGEGALLHLTFNTRSRGRMPARLVHVLRLVNPDPGNGAPARPRG